MARLPEALETSDKGDPEVVQTARLVRVTTSGEGETEVVRHAVLVRMRVDSPVYVLQGGMIVPAPQNPASAHPPFITPTSTTSMSGWSWWCRHGPAQSLPSWYLESLARRTRHSKHDNARLGTPPPVNDDSDTTTPLGRLTSHVLYQGKLYIHAGCPASGRLATLHAYDLATDTWYRLADAPAQPRGGTAIAAVTLTPDSELVLIRFGGFDGFQLPQVTHGKHLPLSTSTHPAPTPGRLSNLFKHDEE
ncbi:hypothetical protein L210DRAFT_3505811 [Boletus edulis BED1]|uniref:Uncharacterized protein n=1 Tax=Boletus edulis BED1 TaxID=1328754 RepID=A0AAD4BPP2_BOLED|nr:hypothetical protein L210DRAFT_3505811 [Boletus edulis BED1]